MKVRSRSKNPSSSSSRSGSRAASAGPALQRIDVKPKPAVAVDSSGEDAMSEEDDNVPGSIERRRVRNMLAARRSRERRKAHTAELESQVQALTRERDRAMQRVAQLEEELSRSAGAGGRRESEAEPEAMVEAKRRASWAGWAGSSGKSGVGERRHGVGGMVLGAAQRTDNLHDYANEDRDSDKEDEYGSVFKFKSFDIAETSRGRTQQVWCGDGPQRNHSSSGQMRGASPTDLPPLPPVVFSRESPRVSPALDRGAPPAQTDTNLSPHELNPAVFGMLHLSGFDSLIAAATLSIK
ncbi:hypothetical protein M427DRAFT_65763 [Gonapodya prolifera JEL478]|uniref:BZIP domain-containing protein n=1 Tax=Gonapodya prolifera (strain JEL478) TaxID=1344416 RepID=A0A139AYL9_GONPJ|nr:hypothetical protein M427DRAFT_65763 [Gonapodya prolifera JEL478]|eukprot:KXS21826.1 hypothetical protein M427DRAFT_65763 [Gonapodya prolifera JEL478]